MHWSSDTTIFKILILVIVSTMVIAAKYARAFLMVPTNWSVIGPHPWLMAVTWPMLLELSHANPAMHFLP
jgi:hypothetical protein